MPRRMTLSAAAAVAVLALAAAQAFSITTITVVAPNGGEIIQAGSRPTILWTSDGNGTVEVDLLKGAVLQAVLTPDGGAINTGSLAATFPGDLPPGDDYRVRVSSMETPAVSDTSDADFTVAAAPVLQVLQPAGGEVFLINTNATISWLADSGIANVAIALLKGGAPAGTVAATTPDDGNFVWTVPAATAAGNDYTIRVSDANNAATFSDSSLFSISTAGQIEVIFPNGGETLAAGSTQEISWIGPLGRAFNIDLLKGGALAAHLAVNHVSFLNVFDWAIPSDLTPGSDYAILVNLSVNPAISDTSDASFAITGPSLVAVTFPNGGETITAGTTQTITWAGLAGQAVRIELLKGGVLDSLIVASVTTVSNSFAWSVPGGQTPGTDYRIRITSVADGTVTDTSDADFAIVAPEGITVTSPNGGEAWLPGSMHPITWTSVGASGNVKIELLRGALIDSVISASAPDTGSFDWTIPAGQASATNYRVRVSSLGAPTLTDTSDAAFTISPTAGAGPLVTNAAAVPSSVHEASGTPVSLVATASDATTGGQTIAGAEYFIGADPGPGNATPMQAFDGAFDEVTETIEATVDTTSFSRPVTVIILRARDSAGNWGPTTTVRVTVTAPLPPGAIGDLAASPAGGFGPLASNVSDSSAPAAGHPATDLEDGDPETFFRTAGTLDSEDEFVTFDLGATTTAGGVTLLPGPDRALFPRDVTLSVSDDGVGFTDVAWAYDLPAVRGRSVTVQFEQMDTRFVRLAAPGVFDRATGRYGVEIAEAAVINAGGTPQATVSFTTPTESVAPLAEFDLRWSSRNITPNNFDVATAIAGLAAPGAPGTPVTATLELPGASGRVFLAIKTIDEDANVSDLSNVVSIDVNPTGFMMVAPADMTSASITTPEDFDFVEDTTVRPAFIEYSNSPGFPQRPRVDMAGDRWQTLRFGLRPGQTSFDPSFAQWRGIKILSGDPGIVYWRLRGVSRSAGFIIGPARSILFDCGLITDLALLQSPSLVPSDTVSPTSLNPPDFVWTDDTAAGIVSFLVDVSTDPAVPLDDRRATTTIGGRGIVSSHYTPTRPEWLRLRRMASSTADATLYWRVRGMDRDRAITCASGIADMFFDGGAWTVGALDFSASPPILEWTNDSPGIALFSVEFSINDQFNPTPRETLRVPSRPMPGLSHEFTPAEVRRLDRFAAANGVGMLHYRVRGEDADRAFVTFSPSSTTAAP